MKKIIALLVVIAGVMGFNSLLSKDNKQVEKINEEEINEVENQVNNIMQEMSLDEKIGQMLIIDFPQDSLTEELETQIKTIKPGGIILFKNNISSYKQTSKLISDIQALANIPMFVSIDQEGGRVVRISSLPDLSLPTLPSMENLGKMNDYSLTYDVGKLIGEELRLFGVNLDFAPVVDVNTAASKIIGDRSFGDNPNTVAKQGINLAKGLNDAGVIAVYKHFPGHGSTTTDSHYDLPVLKETKEELLASNLIPFKSVIKENADMIMVGHLAVPNITGNETPASLSKEIITDLLKKEMGYNGLVITDALNMQALTKNYTNKEIYEMALNAGVDILLMPSTDAVDLIKQSLEEGKITEDQINESVKKILMLKTTKLSPAKLELEDVDLENHQKIISKVQ